MVPGGSPWSTSTDCNPRRAAAAAVSRAWLLCGPPAVITVVAPAASACAQVYCSLRTLFPPPPSPLKSSRLTQRLSCANPRATLRRGAASSGVGQLPSRTGARATSADTAEHYPFHRQAPIPIVSYRDCYGALPLYSSMSELSKHYLIALEGRRVQHRAQRHDGLGVVGECRHHKDLVGRGGSGNLRDPELTDACGQRRDGIRSTAGAAVLHQRDRMAQASRQRLAGVVNAGLRPVHRSPGHFVAAQLHEGICCR